MVRPYFRDTDLRPLSEAPEAGAVWVLSHDCGWSRMVPRSTPAARRRQIIEQHKKEAHS